MGTVHIKRIYDEPVTTDGFRILVDRLWPRGVTKERAALNAWLKGVAPSPELRTWFGHKPEHFQEFSQRYNAELADNPAVHELIQLLKHHANITLLYAAQNPEVNHALVLQSFLADNHQ